MPPEVKQRIEQIRHGEVPEGYKKTALGIVPANWIETTLGKIYTERNEPGNDSLPLLMVSIHSGVSDGEVAEEDLPKKVKRIEDKSQYKHAMPGDLVFNMMRAWQGAIGSVRTEGMVSPAYIVAKPNELVDPVFMDYYMKTPRMVNILHRQSYGVTDFRLRLYWDSFSPIPCVLPPLEEQRQIAEILSAQDAYISLQLKTLAAYQQLKKTFLAKLLPKGGSNEPELRFKGFSDAWEQRKFSEFTWNAGKRNKEGLELVPYAVTSDRGFVRQDEAHDEFGYMRNVDRKAYNIVPPNSFAYNPARINVGSIGYFKGEESVIVSSLYEVFQTADYVDDTFLWQWFKSEAFNNWIERLQEGSVRLYFYYDKLCECQLFLPSLGEQQKIAHACSNIDQLITLHQRRVDFTQTEKDALMQLLLTGLVSVKRRNHGLLI